MSHRIEGQLRDPREKAIPDEMETILSGEEEAADEAVYLELERLEEQKRKLQDQINSKKQHEKPQKITSYFAREKPPKNDFASRLQQNRKATDDKNSKIASQISKKVYNFGLEVESISAPCDEREKYSGQFICKRYISSENVDSLFDEKKILRLEKLFAKVSPPRFEPPTYGNYIVIGVVTKKTSPQATRDGKSKFQKVSISDFKMSVDVLIFGKLVEKYFKLQVGDVIAVLNPQIWPWKSSGDSQNGSHGFNLALTNDHFAILEIGRCRDLGQCSFTTKAGTPCGATINKAKETYCYFHTELKITRGMAHRLELSGSTKPKSPTKNGVKHHFYMDKSKKGMKRSNIFTDQNEAPTGNLYSSSMGASKAFFNDQYTDPRAIERFNKKRKTKDTEREKQLRYKLMKVSGGEALRDLDLESKQDRDEREKITSIAYRPKMLNSLGFNPAPFEQKMAERSNIGAEMKKIASASQKVLSKGKKKGKSEKLIKEKFDQKAELDSDSDLEIGQA